MVVNVWSFVRKLGPPSWTRSLSRTSWSRLLLPPCYSSLLSLGLHLGTTFTFFILFGFLVRFLFFLRGFAGSKPQPPPLILHTLLGSNYHFYRWFTGPSLNTVSIETFSHQQHPSLSTLLMCVGHSSVIQLKSLLLSAWLTATACQPPVLLLPIHSLQATVTYLPHRSVLIPST